MKITGAIFDMDGTLIDSLGFWDYIWKRLGEIYLGDPAFRPDTITEKAVRMTTLYDGMALVHKNCGIGKDADEIFKITEDELSRFYKEKVEMKPGAREFLGSLKVRGVKMCVASATAKNLLETVMEKFGLDEYFSKLFSCNDIGKGKEHPDVFIAAHEYLGTDKESTWIFEDSIVALETATKAGYNTVGIYDRYNFGQDRIKEISVEYIAEDETLMKIIKG